MANDSAITSRMRPPRSMQPLGVMRGRVEYNNDPYQIGRVRVRVPSIHGLEGTKEYVKPEDLPWATPCVVGGAGEDFGMFIAPVPGTFVWVMFEDNDTSKPVYFGGCPSKGGSLSKQMNNLTDEYSPLQKWQTQPHTPEVASDVFDKKTTGVPERHVIYKSQKGHTIMFDDTDGDESISIIDRLGQTMKFKCPVSVADNVGGYRRRKSTCLEGTQLDYGINPSILLRTGETESVHKHNQHETFMDHTAAECVNSDTDERVTNFTDPLNWKQNSHSPDEEITIEMSNGTHFDIKYDFKDEAGQAWVTEMLFDHTQMALTAFNDCKLIMTKDGIELTYKGQGIRINGEAVEMFFKDTTQTIKEKSIESKTPGDIKSEADGAIDMDGNAISLKGEESGIETKDGKTFVTGSEIHLNKAGAVSGGGGDSEVEGSGDDSSENNPSEDNPSETH